MTKIDIYAVGLCSMSICTDKKTTIKEIEEEANASHPTGIKSRWKISGKFSDKQHNPCACDLDANKLHYLLKC